MNHVTTTGLPGRYLCPEDSYAQPLPWQHYYSHVSWCIYVTHGVLHSIFNLTFKLTLLVCLVCFVKPTNSVCSYLSEISKQIKEGHFEVVQSVIGEGLGGICGAGRLGTLPEPQLNLVKWGTSCIRCISTYVDIIYKGTSIIGVIGYIFMCSENIYKVRYLIDRMNLNVVTLSTFFQSSIPHMKQNSVGKFSLKCCSLEKI